MLRMSYLVILSSLLSIDRQRRYCDKKSVAENSRFYRPISEIEITRPGEGDSEGHKNLLG